MRSTREQSIDFFGEHLERKGSGNRDRRLFLRGAARRPYQNESGGSVKSPAIGLFPVFKNRRDVRLFFEAAFKRWLG
jgi:hypothetical protein